MFFLSLLLFCSTFWGQQEGEANGIITQYRFGADHPIIRNGMWSDDCMPALYWPTKSKERKRENDSNVATNPSSLPLMLPTDNWYDTIGDSTVADAIIFCYFEFVHSGKCNLPNLLILKFIPSVFSGH